MDTVDLSILKLISKREDFESYKGEITKALCTKESWSLLTDIGKYFEQHPEQNEIVLEPFAIWQRTINRPSRKAEEHQIYDRFLRNALELDSFDREQTINSFERLKLNQKILNESDRLSRGEIDIGEFQTTISELTPPTTSRISCPISSLSVETLVEYQRDNEGLYWRCEDLNKSIGPLKKGDFVVVAKRPEVGGTSFLCSEMSFMLEQLPENNKAVFFNNEESPDKVFSRMLTTSLGITYRDVLSNPTKTEEEYKKFLGSRKWDLCHDTNMTLTGVEDRLKEGNYGLIGVNVLLKVGGLNYIKEDHDRLQRLGERFRVFAQEYGPVIVIVQADPTAEDMKYIPQDRIYKSKTALQGEADALIMIGKDSEYREKRYIHVAKNKLPPAPCTELINKHIKTEVNFNIETGRFSSINYKGHSRKA